MLGIFFDEYYELSEAKRNKMEQDIILRNYLLKRMITTSALKMKNCPVQQESDKIELSDTTQTDENINSKQTIN